MKRLTGIAITALLLTGCSGVEAQEPTVTGTTPAYTPPAYTPPAYTPEPYTPPAPPEPLVPADFRVGVKKLSQQCFGSAGCNVDIRLELAVLSSSAADRAADITVTVKGDESGPIIETIEVDGAGSYAAPEISMSTASASAKISAAITDVSERP